MNKFLLLAGIIVLSQGHACEDNITSRQQELLKNMARVGAEFSETVRVEFWSPWEKCTADEKKRKSKEFLEIFHIGIEGQRGKYQSALLSISAGKPTYDRAYMEYIESKEKFNHIKGFSGEKIRKEKQQVDEFLNAAITGTPIERNGQMFYLDEEVINEVLAGLDESEKRLKLLLSPPLSK